MSLHPVRAPKMNEDVFAFIISELDGVPFKSDAFEQRSRIIGPEWKA